MVGFIGARQTTLATDIELTGTGVHSGAPASIQISPSEPDSGIRFLLVNGNGSGTVIPADYRSVANSVLCTVLSDGNGCAVATVEHLLAALHGLGVDNALVEIDNGEVPIMDGSAMPFVEAVDEAGICELERPRRFIKVLKTVSAEDGQSWGELSPYDGGFHLDVEIEFDTPLIGRQRLQLDLTPNVFRREIARARTFGFMSDVEGLWAAGLALGASLDNTVAIGDDKVVNQEGTRFPDEFVRHKVLDAIGDLALAGAPLLGAFHSRRGGHRLNNLVLEALFQDAEAWTMVEAPWTAEVEHGELSLGLAAANYAADRT